MNSPPAADAGPRSAYLKSLDCVHCGLCLPHCPTYRVTGDEAASPRGRIYLMRGAAEGKLELNESFAAKMDACLVCRNCETVCPSGVAFGAMMEATRSDLLNARLGSWIGRMTRDFLLRRVVPHRGRLGMLASLTRGAQRLRLPDLARRLGLTRALPRTLRAMIDNLPAVPPAAERAPLPELIPAARGVRRRGRLGFLSGCVMEQVFGEINHRTAAVLSDLGYDVVVPPGQTCCGALHAHAGDLDCARALARRNVAAFDAAGVDRIVFNSAGCAAAVQEYGHWFADDESMAPRARALAAKVIDVLAFFDEQELAPRVRPAGERVRAVYDAPCHLIHAQRCAEALLRVLKRVAHVELVPLPRADQCCGAAGIYNVVQPEMSDAILEAKLDDLERTGARLLLTGNPGCILQWRKGIARRGLDVRVAHPIEIL